MFFHRQEEEGGMAALWGLFYKGINLIYEGSTLMT